LIVNPACENCGEPLPGDDDPAITEWWSSPDGGDPDAGTMWFCPDCQGDDGDPFGGKWKLDTGDIADAMEYEVEGR
jgi:hypothetical protein